MSKRTRNLHGWRTKTEDGTRREVKAQLAGGQWTFRSLTRGDEEWVEHDPPLLEDLEALEEVLFNKYQRKHLLWDHVVGVRKLISLHRSTL